MGKIKDAASSSVPAIRWLGPYPPREPNEENMPGYESKKISSAMRHADDITLAELVRLRVENNRYKDALQLIIDNYGQSWQCTIIARNALNPKTESKDNG